MQKPTVSIIIPVYNAERYVAKAIESVIMQSFVNWELIIVDDSSTDNTFSVCKNLARQSDKIKLFKNEKNLGMMANWNYALSLMNPVAKYWGKLDADDYWHEDMLKDCYEILESESEVGMVCGRFRYVNEHGDFILQSEKVYPEFVQNKSISVIPLVRGGTKTIFKHNLTQQGIGLMRKTIIDKYGVYLLIPAGDTEFHYRVGAHYQIHFVDKVLHFHRIWAGSFTKSSVTSEFGKPEKNLFEATIAIFDHYLSYKIISKTEYKKLVRDAQFEFNKTLIALSRANGHLLTTISLFAWQFIVKPFSTFKFYFQRVMEKTGISSK